MNRPRRLVKNKIRSIVDLIYSMNEKSINVLMADYQGVNPNCAWYEFRIKEFILECCQDRLYDLEVKRKTK